MGKQGKHVIKGEVSKPDAWIKAMTIWTLLTPLVTPKWLRNPKAKLGEFPCAVNSSRHCNKEKEKKERECVRLRVE